MEKRSSNTYTRQVKSFPWKENKVSLKFSFIVASCTVFFKSRCKKLCVEKRKREKTRGNRCKEERERKRKEERERELSHCAIENECELRVGKLMKLMN